jgi:hypothetical protein
MINTKYIYTFYFLLFKLNVHKVINLLIIG